MNTLTHDVEQDMARLNRALIEYKLSPDTGKDHSKVLRAMLTLQESMLLWRQYPKYLTTKGEPK